MPDHPSAVSGVFRRPYSYQVAFFRRKLGNLVPTQRWDDLRREQHDTAFMVAGAQKADLLTDLAAAVDRGVSEGKSLDAFRKDFRAIVERHGWHGWTGEDTKGGRAWRTRTIYRTNASTSYSAGRYAQLVEGNFPLWVYFHGNSKEPRQEHLDWNGLALPPDHVFWITRYPPSAWGCSCYVVGARSARGVRRLGGDPDKKLPDGWDAIDPKTGAPIGVGKNWDYAPGAGVAPQVAAIAEKVRHWDYRIGKAFLEEVPPAQREALARSYRSLPSVADDARRYAQRVLANTGEVEIQPSWTLGLVGDRAGEVGRMVGTDVSIFDFSIDSSSVLHIERQHGNPRSEARRGQRAVTAADYALLPQILNAPDAVIDSGKLGSAAGAGTVTYEKRINGELYHAVFVVRGRQRSLALQTFYITAGKDAPSR